MQHNKSSINYCSLVVKISTGPLVCNVVCSKVTAKDYYDGQFIKPSESEQSTTDVFKYAEAFYPKMQRIYAEDPKELTKPIGEFISEVKSYVYNMSSNKNNKDKQEDFAKSLFKILAYLLEWLTPSDFFLLTHLKMSFSKYLRSKYSIE